MSRTVFAFVLGVVVVCGRAPARAAEPADVDIPFTKHVLGNGLTLLVTEDHQSPIVAVDVWYHVGSKNERPGRTGFAHLFEHLMFNGSEHHDEDWFREMAHMGATHVNGTTSNDRTNYFETVPKGALDAVLWLESDRMGHLVGAIDDAKVDEQRGVVQNEKRQDDNEPYGEVWEVLPSLTYPSGHPYSWPVVGSMADLDAASVDDVKDWFLTYYGAANAVLSIAGDVDTAEVVKKVELYFGDIPSGPPVMRPKAWIAKRTGTARFELAARVPQARVERIWNTPPWGSVESELLDLAAKVLGRGEGSRLYQRLVRKDRLATDVEAYQDDNEIGGQFHLAVTAAEGVDLARVEAALDEALRRFLTDGPTADELEIEKTQTRASFVRRLERLGGFGGKADVLAMNQVFAGRPDAWKDWLAEVANATPQAVRDAAARWLSDGDVVLDVLPFPKFVAAKSGADRAKMPEVRTSPEARFPDLERATLANGMKVILARRAGVPLVRAELLVDVGFADDPREGLGTAALTGTLLTAGAGDLDAVAIQRTADRLGASLAVSTEPDSTSITLSALRENLRPSLALLAEIAVRPTFPDAEVDLARARQVAAISQERMDARGMMMRILPRYLFGEGDRYAVPFSGTGDAASVGKLTRADLVRFHDLWFRPSRATLVVTGDVLLDDLLPRVREGFLGWKEPAEAPPARAAGAVEAPHSAGPVLLLLDRPGAPQSAIVAAQLVPARGDAEELPVDVMNGILGGDFMSRLNMNLREGKHWAYGARSRIHDVRGVRPLVASTSVQTDRTVESVREILSEFQGLAGARPATDTEVARVEASMTLSLLGRWDTSRALGESIGEIVTFGLPDRYFDGYAARIRAITTADVAQVGKLLHPDSLVWIVAGDRRRVEKGLRDLGVAEVHVVDPDGNEVE